VGFVVSTGTKGFNGYLRSRFDVVRDRKLWAMVFNDENRVCGKGEYEHGKHKPS
jgi:hypothetical protein